MIGRPREEVRQLRYQRFIYELARTNDPVEAARIAELPAERALEKLRDLGFTLTGLPTERAAA